MIAHHLRCTGRYVYMLHEHCKIYKTNASVMYARIYKGKSLIKYTCSQETTAVHAECSVSIHDEPRPLNHQKLSQSFKLTINAVSRSHVFLVLI